MDLKLFLLFLCISLSTLSAQDDYHTNLLSQLSEDYKLTGGDWVIADNEQAKIDAGITYGNINASIINISDEAFSRSHSIQVNVTGANPWDAGINIRNSNTINNGDVVLVSFWAKGKADNGKAEVNFFVENGTTFNKEIFIKVSLEENWKQYLIGFTSGETFNPNAAVVGLHLAFKEQQVDYAGLALLNYKSKYMEEELPNTFSEILYEGAELDAAWRAPAQARIEEHRMSKVKLQLTQKSEGDAPIANTTVKVRMLKHDFEFGSAVVSSRIAGNNNQTALYQDKITDLDGKGHGFNTVVFENSLKWKAWEGNWPANQTEKIKAINWLTDNDITIRGHNLLWPGWSFLPSDMEANKDNPTYLKSRIMEHIEMLLQIEEIKNNIRDWDVINEIALVRDLETALQGKSGYPTGRELYPEIFKKVKEIDPTLTTYLNDYVTISNDVDSGQNYDRYKLYIKEILDAGAVIDGIGFQAHIPTGMPGPVKVYGVLDDFYQEFGLEAKITEYDVNDFVSENVAARYMADFLTIIYSHPSVKGFLTWGFWDGAHWKNNAPFFNLDWTLKESGQAFFDKVFDEWWTEIEVTSDAEGFIEFDGFNGQYVIEINDNLQEQFFFNTNTTGVLSFELTSATSEIDFESAFSVFPNPTDGLLYIKSKDNVVQQSFLYDIEGKLLFGAQSIGDTSLDMTGLAPGQYILRIIKNSKSFTKKIIKE